MKYLKLFLAVALFTFCSTQCNQCNKCIENPVNDTIKPKATVNIFYRDANGNEVEKKFDSNMTHPEGTFGHELHIPPGTSYKLFLVGYDAGCIKHMSLKMRKLKNDGHWTAVGNDSFVIKKDFSACAKKNRTAQYDVDADNAHGRIFWLRVSDFGNDSSKEVVFSLFPVGN